MIRARAQFQPRNDLGQYVETFISPAVRASVEASCKLIEDAAKGYCPVDTGALRDSITTEINDTGKTVIGSVGPHMPYADFVEWGTGQRGDPAVPHGDTLGQHPQAYMRPALDENRDTILEVFRDQISAAIKF